MADDIHPVLTPRVADKPDATITLSFDSPSDADKVVIQLLEVDAWGTGPGRRVENAGRDTVIAELTGKIVDGKFVLDKQKPKGKAGDKPEMVLHIDGEPDATNHALPFPKSALVNEDGIFEVEVQVSGVVGKKKKTARTNVPVFLRNFKAGRPVVAFITGNPKADGFFAAADQFWKAVADGKFSRGNVETLRNFLITEADARGFGPWGDVNIVDHGNEFEWIVRLFASDKSARHIHTKDLQKFGSDPRLSNPIPSLDKNSRVIIRGCALGNDQALLDEIFKLFGSQAPVFAPKFIQIYITSGKTAREGFMDMFYFYVPGSSPPSLPDCKAKLSAKYPDVNAADWLPMLRKTGKLSIKDELAGYRVKPRTEGFSSKITFDVEHPVGVPVPSSMGKAEDFIGIARSNWVNDEEHFNTDFDEWKWSQSPLQRHETSKTVTQFVRVVTGKRHRVEVRREKREADGTPVRPDPNNPAHFGRSPAATP